MEQTTSPAHLFKLLQTAITRKTRSLIQTDAVQLWEQDVRRSCIDLLVQQSANSPSISASLNAIFHLETPEGIKLAVLLEELSGHASRLKTAPSTYPALLMQAIMVKPMNVEAAWTLLNELEPALCTTEQVFCIEIIKAELLDAMGRHQEGYERLKPWLQQVNPSLSLRLSCHLRYARMAKSRNTLQAEQVMMNAVQLIESVSKDRSSWSTEFAECARELALLYLACGKHRSALRWGQRALTIFDQLLLDQPDRLDLQLLRATCLRTMAIAERELNNDVVSQKLFSEAIEIIEKLVSNDPQNGHAESELPRNHDVLGDIHLAKLDLDQALHEYSASAAISAHLAFRDPMNMRWRLEEISSAMRIASVLKKTGRTLDSLSMIHAYQDKLKALIEQDPDHLDYRAAFAQMKIQIGDLHWTQQLHDQAADEFREAFEQVTVAMGKDPHYPRWMLLHLLTLHRLAEVEFSRGNLEAAAKTLQQAQSAIVEALKENAHTRKLRQFFVAITTRLSDCIFAIGKTSSAIAVQDKALQLATRYQQEQPDSLPWLLLLSGIQTQTAQQKLRLGLLQESQSLWETAIDSLSQLKASHTENSELTTHLFRALLVKVEWLYQSEQWTQALTLSMEIRDQLHDSQVALSSQEHHQDLLCNCLHHMAYCCHHLGLKEQEFEALQSLEKWRKAALHSDPQSMVLQAQYHAMQIAIGKAMLKAGLVKPAIAYFNEALKGYNALHEKQKKHPDYLLAIGEILINLGQAHHSLANIEATRLVLSKTLLIAGWLGKAGEQNYAMRLGAAQLLLAVAQSPLYAHSQKTLLEMAQSHAVFLQATAQNPALDTLFKTIESLQESV